MVAKVFVSVFLLFSVAAHAGDKDIALQQQIIKLEVELNQKYDLILQRLTNIERLLGAYTVKVLPADAQHDVLVAEPKKTVPARPKWQNPKAWTKITPGMAQSEVIAILGEPTRITQNIIDYITLVYIADQANAGALKGSITLTDSNRVEYRGINAPVW